MLCSLSKHLLLKLSLIHNYKKNANKNTNEYVESYLKNLDDTFIDVGNYVVEAVKTKFAHNIMSSYNSWEILGFIHAFEKYSQGFRALAI